MIRLLFVNDHLGHDGGIRHGATTYFLDVLPRLQASGVAVTACFLGAEHAVAEHLVAAGVSPVFLHRSKWDPRALPDIGRLIRRRRINLVHAAGMKGILLTRLAARRDRIPVLSHFHDAKPPDPLIRFLHRVTASWSDRSLAISNMVAAFANRELGVPAESVKVLYNGVDLSRLREDAHPGSADVRQELGMAPDRPLVAVVARLSAEKGHERFLRALPALLARCPNLGVLFVGEGSCRGSCEQLTRALGLGDTVRFLGFRDDVPRLLKAVDLVAIPSLSEGLSYSALEAMAMGRPVVATAIGGLPEIVRDGVTGRLVKEGDMLSFMDAIAELLSDQALRQRVVAGGRALVNELSVENHVKALLTEYHRLCEVQSGGDSAPGYRARG